MKIALYAKRLGGGGHTFLNVVEVPEGTQEWRVPVMQQISAVGGSPLEIEATSQSITPVRTFRLRYDPLGRALEKLPQFLEL